MSDFDLTISGNKAILDNMAGLQAEIQAQAQATLEQAGQMALDKANELVPVLTGYLKSTLYVEAQPGVVTVGADAPYAIFVELGTRKMAAQPYLVPAMAIAGDWLKAELEGLF